MIFQERVLLTLKSRLDWLLKAAQAYREGRLGDVAAYKSAILGTTAYPPIKGQLATLDNCYPLIDLEVLAKMPEGTFGQAYAQHLQHCDLTPLKISPGVADDLQDFILGIRYMLTHDIFHVLLGYDTSLLGEYGVWTFVAAQNYSSDYDRAARWASIVYPCLQPHRYVQFKAVAMKSRQLAAQAVCLIAQPFEAYWEMPLEDVRSILLNLDNR